MAHALLTMEVARLTLVDAAAGPAMAVAALLDAHFRGRVGAGSVDAVAEAAGLVNCSLVGMAAHPGLPLPAAWLRPALWVVDIVYFPLETELLAAARALGCRTLDGGQMALFQAVGAFRLFTGLEPDPERILRYFSAMVSPPPPPD